MRANTSSCHIPGNLETYFLYVSTFAKSPILLARDVFSVRFCPTNSFVGKYQRRNVVGIFRPDRLFRRELEKVNTMLYEGTRGPETKKYVQ